MSEPKLIQPLLDNFAIGDPISDHNGVRCCPAMDNRTDDRYIVKIVANPASQNQLDALLLSGAFESPEKANSYFKEMADAVVAEGILRKRPEKRRTPEQAAYQRLLEVGQRVMEVIRGAKGRDNKSLNNFARRLLEALEWFEA